MTEELKTQLIKLAKETVWSDDPEFLVCDYAAGNIDDAYYGGYHSGATELARTILKELKIEVPN
jgi:hypothetical protein